MRSISQNADDTDEFAACGFGLSPSEKITAPRISESFLSLECELTDAPALSGSALPLLIGRVALAHIREDYARGYDEKYTPRGFSLNIHSPMDCETGVCAPFGFATLRI